MINSKLWSTVFGARFTRGRKLLLVIIFGGISVLLSDGKPARAVEVKPLAADGVDFYPLHQGSWWLYDVRVKNEKGVERVEVKSKLEGTKKFDGISYSIFVIGEKYKMFIRRDEKGVYLRGMRFPVPELAIELDLDFRPEIDFLRFPLAKGKWSYTGKVSVWKFSTELKIDYENLGRQRLQTPAGKMDCYHFRSRLRYWKIDYSEEYWYARGVGFVKGVNESNPEVLLDYHIAREQ